MGNRFLYLVINFLFITPLVFGQTSGKYEHDGFYMRFLLGGSSSTMTIDGASSDMELSGMSVAFRFQIGAEISKNLIAYGEVGGTTISNPEIKIGDQTYDTEDTKASNFDFGGGLTYYIMPENIYITGSILASRATLEYTGGSETTKSESDPGLGLFFGVGKEWWVSDDWALGAAVFAAFSSVPDKASSDVTISNTSFGVAFSATFQ
jgi:hypothetical protein